LLNKLLPAVIESIGASLDGKDFTIKLYTLAVFVL
jgi:hypothetical protein